MHVTVCGVALARLELEVFVCGGCFILFCFIA